MHAFISGSPPDGWRSGCWQRSAQPLPSPSSQSSSCTVCVSQVYGGRGNSGAPLASDFIELFNATGQAVSLDGMSAEYAPSTSSSWQSIALDGYSLQPYSYCLHSTGTAAPAGQRCRRRTELQPQHRSGQGARCVSAPATTCSTCSVCGSSANESRETAPSASRLNTSALLRQAGGCTRHRQQ